MEPRTPFINASVVIVTHNSADVLVPCLASIHSGAEVIVVDNGSSDGWRSMVGNARDGIAIIALGENVGFGAACNVGGAAATREIVVFLNPDAVFRTNALETLVSRALETPGNVVGPALLAPGGEVRFVCRRRSLIRQEVAELLPGGSRCLPEVWSRNISSADEIYVTGGKVDYLQGACIAMARRTFQAIGGFDDAFFLYSEEEDLCERVGAKGGLSIYEPRAQVVHIWGTSSRKKPLRSMYHRYRSCILLARKRGGSLRGALAAFGLALLVPLRVAMSPISWARGSTPVRGPLWGIACIAGLAAGATAQLGTHERPAGGAAGLDGLTHGSF